MGKLGMNEGCELVRRPQLRQVQRSHVLSQPRNPRESFDGSLDIEALCEGVSHEGKKDQQRPHGYD